MRGLRTLRLVLAVSASPLTGCSAPGLTVGQVAAILETHPVFPVPVSVTLPVEKSGDLLFRSGLIARVPRECLGAKLVEAGIVNVEPDTAGPPWWKLRDVEDQVLVVVGTREITGHGNKRRWKEGAIRFYAETITYKLVGPQNLPKSFPRTYGPFTMRLVAVRDPRNDVWQLDTSQSVVNTDAELAAFSAPLLASGTCNLDTSAKAIADARRRAMDEIEASLAREGNLARGPTPDILVNQNAKLAYYAVRKDFDSQRSFADAEAYCRSVRVPNLGPWRIPSMAELNTVIGSDRHIRDVPDHRLWGQVFAVNPGSVAALYAASDGMNAPRVNYPFRWMQVLDVGPQRTASWTIKSVFDNGRPFGGEGGIRVLCVADWPRK